MTDVSVIMNFNVFKYIQIDVKINYLKIEKKFWMKQGVAKVSAVKGGFFAQAMTDVSVMACATTESPF
ncbi:MAG: hypothetical protein J7K96_00760 [Desulfobacteraceae bacterium]|nr:hypothetical protein [Desulfobacteraceae bacterium]